MTYINATSYLLILILKSTGRNVPRNVVYIDSLLGFRSELYFHPTDTTRIERLQWSILQYHIFNLFQRPPAPQRDHERPKQVVDDSDWCPDRRDLACHPALGGFEFYPSESISRTNGAVCGVEKLWCLPFNNVSPPWLGWELASRVPGGKCKPRISWTNGPLPVVDVN